MSVLVEGHGRVDEVLGDRARWVQVDLTRTVGGSPRSPRSVWIPVVMWCVRSRRPGRVVGRPDEGIGFGLLRHGGLSEELAGRPPPSIAFNYLGKPGAGSICGDGSGEVVGFLPAGDAPVLEPSVSGLLPLMAVLAADAWVVASPAGSVLQIRLRYATAVP